MFPPGLAVGGGQPLLAGLQPRLARLNIFGTKVTEAGERGLKEALPAVEVQR